MINSKNPVKKSSSKFSDNNNIHSYIGIDVAKDKLDIFIFDLKKHITIPNSKKDINKFIKDCLVNLTNPVIVCEYTGGCERVLLLCAVELNMGYHMVHPSKIFYYAKSKGILAKTDKIDSKTIASYGNQEQLLPLASIDQNHLQLKDLLVRKIQIKKAMCAELQRKRGYLNKTVKSSIDKAVKFYQKLLIELDKEIDDLLSKTEVYKESYDLLTSMKGIGKISAQTLIILLPELGTINKKQIASLVGLAPINKDSGKKIGYRSIRGGRMDVRNALYMASLSAIKYNPILKSYYQKLVERGKVKMVALVAAMRKMLIILNSMMANKTYFRLIEN